MFACCCAATEGKDSVEIITQLALDHKHGELDAEVSAAPAIEDAPPLSAPAASGAVVPASFKVTLVKDTSTGRGSTGWRLDRGTPDVLHVFELKESDSPIAAYNATVGAERKIQIGDYIKSVNGHTAIDTMAEMAAEADVLELVVQRPHIFTLSVDKQGGSLGVELKHWSTGTGLMVGSVHDGEVEKQGLDLRPGDRITSANGASCSSAAVLNQIKSMQTLELVVSRCP